MPSNKNALLRYKILDEIFSDFNKQWIFDEILEEVDERIDALYNYNKTRMQRDGISIRQIRDDIWHMRNFYKAPIIAIPTGKNEKGKMQSNKSRKHYYRYSDPKFRIFKNEISDEALEAVRKTIDLLGQYRGIPANGWMDEILSTFEINLGIKPKSDQFVSLERNENLKGLHYLSELITHTIEKHVVKVKYKPFRAEEREIIFHPYHVKQYNNRWYVYGLNEESNQLWNLALDRMVSIRMTDGKFIDNNKIDFSTYFDQVVGVTIPNMANEPEKIVIRFSDKRLPYILTKPIHKSQVQSETDPNCIEINVISTKELISLILSYGPDAQVISPESIRDKIKEEIQGMSNLYVD